jgi:hypothetical protein
MHLCIAASLAAFCWAVASEAASGSAIRVQRVNACGFAAAPDAIHGRMSSLGEERAKTSPNTPSREAMIGYDQRAQL